MAPESRYDFNVLETRARELFGSGKPQDALKIYLFMADGDQSLDGGYLAERIAECYECLTELHAAKYWYGRAVEENPAARPKSLEKCKQVEHVTIDDLLKL